MGRRVSLLLSTVVVVAVVAPVLRGPGHDSFPLSSYPMFSTARGREAVFATAVGLDADGERRFLSPGLLATTDEPVQAAVTVAQAVEAGEEAIESLCAAVSGRSTGRDLVEIEVVTETYDAVAWFDGDRRPRARVVHARCPVPAS
jgi:hypothetical protein